MQGVYILSAVRTPIGKFGGTMASLTAADMGVLAAKAAMERAGVDPSQVEETILGNARQAGGGPNVARQISMRSGVPQEVPAFTVNKACASGMKAIALAYQAITLGDATCILAGGTESMSRVPYLLDQARWGYRLGTQELVDGMYRDGFFCPLAKMVMGETAEVLAEQYKISREEQDEFALTSQTRAARAIAAGRFDAEIVPVTERPEVRHDEGINGALTAAELAAKKPAFRAGGTVTGGNSSPLNDGAAALLLMSADAVRRAGVTPLARYAGSSAAGVHPDYMGIGPVPAMHRALRRPGWRLEDLDLIEINEAFAAQSVAVMDELKCDPERVNVNGGAIAIGHPLGCSGARIITTLLHEMRRRGATRGAATMCIGVGQGIASLWEAA